MKQPFKHLRHLRTILLCTLLLFSSTHAFSTNISATNPSTSLIPSINNFSSIQTLNCDMIDIAYNGKLTAVVYDGYSVTNGQQECGLRVDFNGTPSWAGITDIISTSGQYRNPDVAIIDKTNGTLGKDYRIIISVENTWTNEIELFEATITNVGGTISYPGISPLRTIPNTHAAGKMCNPHIDAAGDPGIRVSNLSYGLLYYGSDDFVVCWEEHSGFLPGIWASPYNYSTALTANNPVQVFSGYAQWSDVACRGHYTKTPPASATYTASISLVDSISRMIWVGYITADKTGTVYSSGGGMPISPGTPGRPDYGYPRIEARRVGDVTPGVVNWEVVADANTGLGFWEIHTFNDVAGLTPLAVSSTNNHYRPAVTGTGQANSATGVVNFGSEKFTVSYYSDDVTAFTNSSPGGDYVSNFVDMNGGGLFSPDYYEVQNYSLNQFFTVGEPCIAVSTSSNTGDDLLTVYYDGYNGTNGEIKYKFMNGNTINYKTGSNTPANIVSSQDYKLAPNPAKNVMEVYGVADGSYTITDMMGRIVKSGSMSNNISQLDVSNLQTGNYILNITENKKTQHLKFVKQ